jgi:hypothetical protein
MSQKRGVWGLCTGGGFAIVVTTILWSLAGISGATTSVPIDERVIPLNPGTSFVRVAFLTGEFDDLRVTEHVERTTGRLVGFPLLRATLTLKNGSLHHAAHLLGGKIDYLNAEGNPIVIPPDEGGMTLPFLGRAAERLDPGREVSLSIAVPYPVTALTPNRVREVRLDLTYTSTLYRQDTAKFPVVVGE